jgi:signal transduction histidine kinase
MADATAFSMPLTGLVPGQVPAEILAIVAHDLRTPLNAISMGASLLGDETQPEQQKTAMLEIIQRAAHRMDRLIGDLLEAGRIDAGRTLRIEPAPVELAAVIEQVCAEVRAGSRLKGQTLEAAVPDGLPLVLADRTRLAQVLANLIANAAKFTPRGGHIQVSAARRGEAVQVSVSDTGPGIAADDLPHVFEPYWQARSTASLGCGLGLKIARAIVEAHGGAMWVASNAGEGATFTFTVPEARP